MTLRYGFTPDQLANMTPAQFALYATYDDRPGAVPHGKTAEQARDELRRRRAEYLKQQGKP